MADSESGVAGPSVRKIRVHKRVQSSQQSESAPDARQNADIERRIAELIPGIADVSVSGPSSSTMAAAAAVRSSVSAKDATRRRELSELASIFDMSVPNPIDDVRPDPSKPWVQKLRPEPRRISLSHYQVEMINYQRMLLRKNIWYYRDRLNNPRCAATACAGLRLIAGPGLLHAALWRSTQPRGPAGLRRRAAQWSQAAMRDLSRTMTGVPRLKYAVAVCRVSSQRALPATHTQGVLGARRD